MENCLLHKTAIRVALFVLPWIVSPPSHGFEIKNRVETNWTIPLREEPLFGMLPREHVKPEILGELLYIGSLAGTVQSIHRSQGYALWKTVMAGPIEGSLALGRSKVVVGDREGNLSVLNSHDGAVNWQVRRMTEWLSPAAISRGRIIAVTSSDDVYAFEESQPVEAWPHYSGRGDKKMTVRGTSTPIVYGSDVYVGFSSGRVASLQLESGKVNWDKQVSNPTERRFEDVDVRVYVDESSVIVSTFEGTTSSLNRLTGETQWTFPVGTSGGYLVEENRVFFAGSNGKFYALERDSGQPVWVRDFEGRVGSVPVRVGKWIVFSTAMDPLYVLDPKTGNIETRFWLGAGGAGGIAVSESGEFYCISNYGNLYSLSIRQERNLLGSMPMLGFTGF